MIPSSGNCDAGLPIIVSGNLFANTKKIGNYSNEDLIVTYFNHAAERKLGKKGCYPYVLLVKKFVMTKAIGIRLNLI